MCRWHHGPSPRLRPASCRVSDNPAAPGRSRHIGRPPRSIPSPASTDRPRSVPPVHSPFLLHPPAHPQVTMIVTPPPARDEPRALDRAEHRRRHAPPMSPQPPTLLDAATPSGCPYRASSRIRTRRGANPPSTAESCAASIGHAHPPRNTGIYTFERTSSASPKPSPRKLMESTVSTRKTPGKVGHHQLPEPKALCALERMLPQLASG